MLGMVLVPVERSGLPRWRQALQARRPAAGARQAVLVPQVYDAQTRSQIRTDQNKAALRSMFELVDAGVDAPVELYFGPDAPDGAEGRWIKTIQGKGWFVYFRIYGPEQPAFDGSWQLPDFEAVG
jgi:hypothetical protein